MKARAHTGLWSQWWMIKWMNMILIIVVTTLTYVLGNFNTSWNKWVALENDLTWKKAFIWIDFVINDAVVIKLSSKRFRGKSDLSMYTCLWPLSDSTLRCGAFGTRCTATCLHATRVVMANCIFMTSFVVYCFTPVVIYSGRLNLRESYGNFLSVCYGWSWMAGVYWNVAK
jgi:hypothetical protein